MRTWCGSIGFLLLWMVAAVSGQAPALRVGDSAPDFSLAGTDGRTYTLAEFRGVRPVVLAWFPKAFAKV